MTADICRNCPRPCTSPRKIVNGKLHCKVEKPSTSGCSQCGAELTIGHFAYEPTWREFWCEDCLREMLDELESHP